MRTLIKLSVTLGLLAPALSFAAYNDVTLTTDVVLSVNSVSVNVSGSSATIESIVVNSGNFVATLAAGSTMTISAPDLSVTTEPALGITVSCSGGVRTATIPSSGGATVTVVPSSTACETSSSSSSAGGGPIASGSGGGGGGSYVPPALTQATTPASIPSVPASGLTVTQVDAILSLLSSFDADAVTIANVRSALYGQASGGAGAAAVSFTRDLEVGVIGDDVKALQVYLNTHGYTVSSSGPGSPGNETTRFGGATKAALIKFQKTNGITPAAGYFGPKTRGAVK